MPPRPRLGGTGLVADRPTSEAELAAAEHRRAQGKANGPFRRSGTTSSAGTAEPQGEVRGSGEAARGCARTPSATSGGCHEARRPQAKLGKADRVAE